MASKSNDQRTEDSLERRQILKALRGLKNGKFSIRLPDDLAGVDGEIATAFNDTAETLQELEAELSKVGKAVGREGKVLARASLENEKGSWKSCIDSTNMLIGDLVQPIHEVSQVISAVANGILSRKMPLEIKGRSLRGEFQRMAKTTNVMVDQLNSFASEVTRVAREVGTEGKLGGQAVVKGVAGVWLELTDNVNSMANNLTDQVRNIAEVTTAVANGDLSKTITVEARGEILELSNTINTMVSQLNSFASEVTRVAREVGTDGKRGGQAEVTGVAGVWKNRQPAMRARYSPRATGSVGSTAHGSAGSTRECAMNVIRRVIRRPLYSDSIVSSVRR